MNNAKLSRRTFIYNTFLIGAGAFLANGCTTDKTANPAESQCSKDKPTVLYLGDSALKGPGSYLTGVMNLHNISFDYLPTREKFSDRLLNNNYSAIIMSDYPARNFSPAQLNSIAEKVKAGMGLLMIGGWTSFAGVNSEYTNTILSRVLPVIMQQGDDRVNCYQPCLLEKACKHQIIDSLPFDQKPPAIGGFNRVTAKSDAAAVLFARRFEAHRQAKAFKLTPFEKPDPLLVVGSYGKGRATAFATDVAPHWVGGLVDWGDKTITARAPGANAVQIGNWYAQLFANMINWTANRI